MDIRRKIAAWLLVLVFVLSMAGTVSAEEVIDPQTECIQGLMNYYSNYQDDAETDINCLLYELSELDPELGQAWGSIMEYWSYVDNNMTIYPEILPNGLPQTNALCIVVLGYALADDGSMRQELVGRLQAALASSQKYPNAFILCTGGGTAEYNKKVTEAGQMAKWLINNGVDKNRIIVEDQSFSTVSNAVNSHKILSEKYPQVTHLALVTSEYHLPRACLLFHAQTTLEAMKTGLQPLIIAANAAFDTGRGSEDTSLLTSNLAQLTGVNIKGLKKPALSKLDRIEVSGETQYDVGVQPDMQVIAHYDTGLYRDVSRRVQYGGLNLMKAGAQDVIVAYEEGNAVVSTKVTIEMLAAETEPPTEAPTEAPTEPPATEPVVPEETEPTFFETYKRLIIPAAIVVVLVIAEFFIILRMIRLRKLEKAAKAAAEAEKLPDDDSPLEYV